jgi:hypothetical protein
VRALGLAHSDARGPRPPSAGFGQVAEGPPDRPKSGDFAQHCNSSLVRMSGQALGGESAASIPRTGEMPPPVSTIEGTEFDDAR